MNTTESFVNGSLARSLSITEVALCQGRKALLDYLGCLLGGQRFLEEKHPEFRKVFSKELTTNAAMLDGFASHVLELDDGHRHGMIHLGASIVTAVLEATKDESIKSDDVLKGIIMGYEAAVRCARAIQPGHKERGYHVSGTCGTIGSAMGVAFARGYSKEQLKSTLACAVTSAAGLLEIQEESSELKPYNVGRAAIDGIIAAQIGRMAMPGPDDILGGKRGFLAALTDTPHPEMLTDFTNAGYAIEGIYQKVHAACRHCHPAIDSVLALRSDLQYELSDIEKIEVHTYKLAVGSHDHTDIKGVSSAKLSTPFSVALALVKGSAGYDDYNEDNLRDYWIKNITQKVKVLEDDELTQRSPAIRGARVTLYLKNGGVFEAPCLYPKGEPENPLTQEELENKFRGLAMYSGLSEAECDAVLAGIWKDDFSLSKILDIVCKK